MTRRRHRRGMSLIGTLLIASLLLVLAFTTAAMTFSHFTLSNSLDRAQVCASLAEAAANRAISRCLADVNYGTQANISEDVVVTFDSAPGGWGKVYFGGNDAVQFGNVPRSHNFLSEQFPRASSGRTVPSHSLHIIAWSQWGKTRRAVETIVCVPAFKYAIASTGKVSATGGLLVAGVKNPAAVENGVNNIPDDQWAPGCLLSNSADPQAALDLDSGDAASRITGDVQAVGAVKLGANTTVEGAVKAFHSAENVPVVQASDFDTQNLAGCNATLSDNEWALKITGPARRSGNLDVTGGLTLDSGILYVDGDVKVHGGLHGKGALISSGKVEIYNQSGFQAADDQAAIVAQSDVKLRGNDKDHCIYNGVIYTQGDFQAQDVTLLGSLCAGKAEGSKVDLQRVSLLNNPVSLNLQYVTNGPSQAFAEMHRMVSSLGIRMPGGFQMQAGGYDYQQSFISDPQAFFSPFNRSDFGNIQVNGSLWLDMTDGRSEFNSDYTAAWDPAAQGGAGGFSAQKFEQAYPMGMLDGNARLYLPDVTYQGDSDWSFEQPFNGPGLYQALRGTQPGDAQPAAKHWLKQRSSGRRVQVSLAEVLNTDSNLSDADWGNQAARNFISNIQLYSVKGPDSGAFDQTPYPLNPYRNGSGNRPQPQQMDWILGRWLSELTGAGTTQVSGRFNFNPMQFIQLRDQNQRLLWREYTPEG